MPSVYDLMATIGLDDSAFQAGLAKAKTAMETFASDIKAAGEGLTKVVTAPLTAIGVGLVAAGGQVDAAYDQIVIRTGATGKALEGLQQSFGHTFGQVTQSAEEVGNALGLLSARTGQTGAALENLTKQSLNLSRLQGTDLTSTLNDVTRFFGDSSIAVNEQSQALDFLFRVSQKTGTTVDALTQKMVFYGAPLRQMGIGWQQAAILMGKWEKEGVNTELVMGSLRIALMRFASQGIKEPAQALPLLIERIKDAKTQGEATAIAMSFFGARAGADMAAAIREGRFAIGDYVKALKDTGDGINETVAKTDDWREHLTMLWHEVVKTVEPVGTQFFNAVTKVVDEVKGPLLSALQTAVKWWTSLGPGVQTAIVALAAFAAALGPVLFAVGAFVTAIAPLLPALGAIVAFLSGPWGIALAGAAAAVYLMTTKGARNLTEWKNNVMEFFAWAAPFFRSSWEAIKDIVVGAWGVLNDTIGAAVQGLYHEIMAIVALIKGDWREAWQEIKLAFSSVWEGLVDLVENAGARLVKGIKNLWKQVTGALSGGTKEQLDNLNAQVVKDSGTKITESLADQHLKATVAKSGEILGNDFVGGLTDTIGKASSAQTAAAINKLIDAGIKQPKKPKLTDAQKEQKALQAELNATRIQTEELALGVDHSLAKLYAKYRLLGHGAVEPLIEAQKKLKEALDTRKEMDRWVAAMDEAKAKIVEFKTVGDTFREALSFKFPHLERNSRGRQMLDDLAKTLQVEKELNQEAKKKRENQDLYESHLRSEANKVADLHAEYLKLTHTRQEDQLALEQTGKLFDDLDDKQQTLIEGQIHWQGLIDEQKKRDKEEKDYQSLVDQTTASMARLRHELTLRSEAEEALAQGKRNVSLFQDLAPEFQQTEINEWLDQHKDKIHGNIAEATKLAIAELTLQHQLAAKKQADKDANDELTRSNNLTEQLTTNVAEANAQLATIKGEAPKHSAFVTKILADVQAGTLKLTEAQRKLFDQLVTSEEAAPAARLTEEMKKHLGQLNEQLDQLGVHKHSAYVRLLEDLRAHGKLTDEQVALLKKLEDAEDKIAKDTRKIDRLKALFEQTKQVFNSFFDDLVTKGKLSFNSLIQGFTQMLQKMAAEYLASQVTKLIFTALGAGPEVTGARAMGGSVDAGKTYLVGENGPELFRAPMNGDILPNSQLQAAMAGVGGPTNVHITVYAHDAQSFRQSNTQIAEDLHRALESARRRNG